MVKNNQQNKTQKYLRDEHNSTTDCGTKPTDFLTFEQKILLSLFCINQNIKIGICFVVWGILNLIMFLSFSRIIPEVNFLFAFISVIGSWGILIAIIYRMSKDKSFLKNKMSVKLGENF